MPVPFIPSPLQRRFLLAALDHGNMIYRAALHTATDNYWLAGPRDSMVRIRNLFGTVLESHNLLAATLRPDGSGKQERYGMGFRYHVTAIGRVAVGRPSSPVIVLALEGLAKAFPEIAPPAATAEDWARLVRLAQGVCADLLKAGQGETASSRRWQAIGEAAQEMVTRPNLLSAI